jgi:hypothetical protein
MRNTVTTEAGLEEIYGPPIAVAITKELDHISDHHRAFIEKSPFVVIASSGPEGLDCTPRGDPAGFVRVVDQNTVLIPDRRGNNRIDTLRNIVRDPRIALLFLIPGIGQTLRINGRAEIRTDVALRESFTMQNKVPATVIAVTAERVYTQCPKALVRSKLWDTDTQIPRSALPSPGEMMQAIDADFDGPAYDAGYEANLRKTIY